MSGIPVIGKVFDAIKKNKVLKAVVVAAVVYFTVSAAASYFSTAGAEAAAGSQLGGTVFTDTAAAAATETQALGMSTVGFDVGATVGADATAAAATATTPASAGMVAGVPGAAGGVVGGAVTPPIAPEPSWFAENPMATMMLGQGVMGAAGSYEQAKAEEAALAQREQERKDRGLFGFDYEGQPAGVISSAMQQPVAPQQVQATQAPIVAGQQVATPGAIPQQIPIQRKDLPKLNQAGQIALG